MTRTKVWHVFGTMNIGGAELRTLELGTAIAAHGVNFEYVTLSGSAGALDDRISAHGGSIHPMPLGPTFPMRFYRALRRHRPDVLDTHVATFSGVLVFIAWLARTPVRIAHFRSDGDGHADSFRRRFQRALMVLLIHRFATDIVGVSPSSLSDGYRADWAQDSRARVIPNGLALPTSVTPTGLRDEMGLGRDDMLLMHVGRPSPEKNRPMAVQVLHALIERGRSAHLALVGGQGADVAAVAEAVDSCGVHSRVHDLGQRSDVRSLMAQADVVLLTSDREGLPGVVLESLSVGTPVVSTPLPGVQFIASKVPGVRMIDRPGLAAWAEELTQLARNIDQAQRRWIREGFLRGPFSLERSTMMHLEIYQRDTMR